MNKAFRLAVKMTWLLMFFSCEEPSSSSSDPAAIAGSDGVVSAGEQDDQGERQEDRSVTEDEGRADQSLLDAEVIDSAMIDLGISEDMNPSDMAFEDMNSSDMALEDMDPSDMALGDMLPPEEVPCVQPISQLEFVVWPQVFANNCTQCHLPGGFAEGEGSGFILHDPDRPERESREDAFDFNLNQIINYRFDDAGDPLLIPKALGQRNHGGLERIGEGSEAHQALIDFYQLVDRAEDPDCTEVVDDVVGYREIMGRLDLKDPHETFRSFTIQVLGRLPTNAEKRRISNGEQPSLSPESQSGRPPQFGPVQVLTHESSELRVVFQMIGELLRSNEAKAWLKESWNEVFLFRGIYAQNLARPYEVFSPRDYGARHWSDMCDVRVFETDRAGDWIIGPGRQPLCELEHEQFNFPAVTQPNPSGSGYRGQASLSPVEACDYCLFTRHGVAEWMLYGAVEEPLELIAHVIQHDQAFSEIITTQDVMMNYYTSLVYFGTADPAENDFTADMSEVPTRTEHKNGPHWEMFNVELPDHTYFKRLNRIRRTVQNTQWISYTIINELNEEETETGSQRDITFATEVNPSSYDEFPRAGILTTPAFLARFPSNEFNLHRHRAWQVLRLFLDYDILSNQGERVSLTDIEDPNAGATLTQSDCASCHTILDPVAGLFKDFHTNNSSLSAQIADRDWPDELTIHQPGWPSIDGGAEQVHSSDAPRTPPIRILAEQLAQHPRFMTTMVKHAWAQVMGSQLPKVTVDPSDEYFQARSTLLLARDRFIDSVEQTFSSTDQNMISVYQRLFTSTWYRIKGLTPDGDELIPDRVYEQVGRSGTLTPEEYFRRLEAVYGAPWPLRRMPNYSYRSVTEEEQLKRQYFTRTDTWGNAGNHFDLQFGLFDQGFTSFFGGIDFQNTLTRAEQINSVMSLLARRVANEFACLVVYRDLLTPANSTKLISQSVINEEGIINQAALENNLVRLIERILGVDITTEDSEVDLAYSLWLDARDAALLDDQNGEGGLTEYCRAHQSENRPEGIGEASDDPDGEARAWMAVITYLLLQPEFLQR